MSRKNRKRQALAQINPLPKQTQMQEIEQLFSEPMPNQLHERNETTIIGATWIAPIPPAAEMQRYDEVHPGAAGIILGQFKQQGDHRRAIEKQAVNGEETRGNRGQTLGFIACLLLIGLAFLGFVKGYSWESTIVITLTLVSLVSVFRIGTVSRRTERQEKAEIMVDPTKPLDPE